MRLFAYKRRKNTICSIIYGNGKKKISILRKKTKIENCILTNHHHLQNVFKCQN